MRCQVSIQKSLASIRRQAYVLSFDPLLIKLDSRGLLFNAYARQNTILTHKSFKLWFRLTGVLEDCPDKYGNCEPGRRAFTVM